MRKIIAYTTLFWGLLAFDYFTKKWALRMSDQQWSLNKYMHCDVVINRGISWSMFESDSSVVFIALSLIISLIILLFGAYTVMRMRSGAAVWPHIIIMAGAVGNLIDRVTYHGVVDFISLKCAGYNFPIFNVADICIVLGIFALLWHERDV